MATHTNPNHCYRSIRGTSQLSAPLVPDSTIARSFQNLATVFSRLTFHEYYDNANDLFLLSTYAFLSKRKVLSCSPPLRSIVEKIEYLQPVPE